MTPALTFNPGMRADWLRGFGSGPVLEPRASLVWALPGNMTAHVGYARYAAAPPPGQAGPIPALADEIDDYLDAGVQRRIGPLTFGLGVYWRGARDLLVEHDVPGAVAPSAFAFRHARLRGVEFSTTYARGPVAAWANLSFSRAQASSTPAPTPSHVK